MVQSKIGEPIPLGDPLFLNESARVDEDMAENSRATIEALRSDIVPSDVLSTRADEMPAAPPAVEPSATVDWANLVEMSWKVALVPAMAWTSHLAASWKAWENSVKPAWPSR